MGQSRLKLTILSVRGPTGCSLLDGCNTEKKRPFIQHNITKTQSKVNVIVGVECLLSTSSVFSLIISTAEIPRPDGLTGIFIGYNPASTVDRSLGPVSEHVIFSSIILSLFCSYSPLLSKSCADVKGAYSSATQGNNGGKFKTSDDLARNLMG